MRVLTNTADRPAIVVVAALTGGRILLVTTEAGFHPLAFGAVIVGLALTWIVKHNAIHRAVFRHRLPNRLFEHLLAVNTGSSTSNTALVHNDIHHVHDNGPADWTRLSLVDRIGSPTGRLLAYPFAVLRSIGRCRGAHLRDRPELRRRIRIENAVIVTSIVGSGVWAPAATIWYLVVPMVAGQLLLLTVNYLEHVGCAPGRANDVTNPWFNRLTFNVGLHSAHHARPEVHWSELRSGEVAALDSQVAGGEPLERSDA